jgi:DNA mismatch repair protein MSH3
MDSIDDNDVLTGSGATLLCISESLMGGMGADERVLFGMVSICPSTAEIIYDEFVDTGMRPELEARTMFCIIASELRLTWISDSVNSYKAMRAAITKGKA